MTVFLALAVLLLSALFGAWVALSMLRLTVAALLLLLAITHSTPPLWLCATLAVGLATLAVVIVVRALDEFGWKLVVGGGE